MKTVLLQIILISIFTARWITPNTVQIVWMQDPDVTLMCLYRQPRDHQPVLVRCFAYPEPGNYGVMLGSQGPLDASYRAAAGDTYILRQTTAEGRSEARTTLQSVLYFPAFP